MFFVSTLILTTTSSAIAKETTLLNYTIYAGGFKIMEAELDMSMGKSEYNMNMEAKTEGFIGSLFPWSAKYETSGKSSKDGKLIPTSHKELKTWKDTTKTTKIDYDKDGNIKKKIVNEGGKTFEETNADKILSGNAVDVLTGVLNMIQIVKNSNECNGKIPVFDGKRKFNINLKNEGKETIQPSKYSIFSGEAIKCTLTVEPISGFKEKDTKRGWMAVQNHTKEYNKLPTIWLATTGKNKDLIPVRLQLASSYGAVIAHLSKESFKNK